MKIAIVIAIIIVVIAALWMKSHYAAFLGPPKSVTVNQIPLILSQLKTPETDPAFAVFMFGLGEPNEKDPQNMGINVQLVNQHGQLAFDWLLTSPLAVADQERFIEFAKSKGYNPKSEQAENGTKYIRVKDGGIGSLCSNVIADFYHIPGEARLGLIAQGFEW